MNKIRNGIKLVCPPLIINIYKYFNERNTFTGNYSFWGDALKECTGYETGLIIERVKNSILKVKNGEALFERDSVIFNKEDYNFPLLSTLMYVSSIYKNELRIIDFGGSLGSTYFQCRKFLNILEYVEWSIVEQSNFVECGMEYFNEKPIDFFYSMEECLKVHKKDVLLLSSVIQYLDKPYEYLEKLFTHKIPYIIIDRTPFFDNLDRITIQKVPCEIYNASYPAWFFNHTKFLNVVKEKYDIVFEWDSFETWNLKDTIAQNKGMLLKIKEV